MSENSKNSSFLCYSENIKMNYKLKIEDVKSLDQCNNIIEYNYNFRDFNESLEKAQKQE